MSQEKQFICERCGHDAKTKGNLITHLQKHNPCHTTHSKIEREKYIKKLTEKPITENSVTCKSCNKVIHKAGLSRHNASCNNKHKSSKDETKASSSNDNRQVILELRQLVKLLTEENKRLNNSQVKVVFNLNGQTINNKDNKKYKKKNIPHTVKINCWNTHVGELVPKTKCLCCNNVDVTQHNFHCGHVIAECNGGTYQMDNLLPICNVCNSSMGSINMNEFKKMYGFV